jgi:hypothetical protein
MWLAVVPVTLVLGAIAYRITRSAPPKDAPGLPKDVARERRIGATFES